MQNEWNKMHCWRLKTNLFWHKLMTCFFPLSKQSYWEQNSPYSTNYTIPPQQQSSVHQSQQSHAPGTILDSIGVPVSTQVSEPCHLQQSSPRGTNVGIVSAPVLSEEIGPMHHQLPPTPGTLLDCEGSPLSSEVRKYKNSPWWLGWTLNRKVQVMILSLYIYIWFHFAWSNFKVSSWEYMESE